MCEDSLIMSWDPSQPDTLCRWYSCTAVIAGCCLTHVMNRVMYYRTRFDKKFNLSCQVLRLAGSCLQCNLTAVTHWVMTVRLWCIALISALSQRYLWFQELIPSKETCDQAQTGSNFPNTSHPSNTPNLWNAATSGVCLWMTSTGPQHWTSTGAPHGHAW